MIEGDWNIVSEIYKKGIETGHATFETKIPTRKKWDNAHIKSCRITAWVDTKIVGWAALSPVSSRCVYGGVAEVSVYVDTDYNRKGIGTKLLQELIRESEAAGFWTLQSGIFPENKASIKVHKNLGFREIGFREKVGKMKGVWRDNIILERRSKIIGIN
jgi:phosphinothricin acetyltransferase